MNKTREQWARIDPKFCAENNSIAAMTFLLADAKEDIENLHRERVALAAECERLTAKLAQPAEAEGVDRQRIIEAMCLTWRHDFWLDKPEGCPLSSGMTEAERDALRRQMGQLFDNHFGSALASVTAERDRLDEFSEALGRQIADAGQREMALRAEVEALRALLGKSLPIVEAHAGASHMLEGFRPTRNKWDELVDGIRAAMAAKEGGVMGAYIEVRAEVRYWEDATVNGVEDSDGSLVPLRDGYLWAPVIRLCDGAVMDWPASTEASIHYKVCDQGEYWLLDEARNRVAKWASYYVPDEFLCHGDDGYGDYIIFRVGADGKIENWRTPGIDPSEWNPLTP